MNWDKVIGLLCYGMSQGVKLAETENPYKIGQHTEAMRLTMLSLVRELPEDKQTQLIDAFEDATGIRIDLRPAWEAGEGSGKP